MPEINLYLDLLDLSELKTLCLEKGAPRTYERGEPFLNGPDVPQEFGFVESGYFKFVVRTTAGAEKVVGFSFADDFVGNINCSLLGVPSEVDEVAGCRSVVHVVTMDTLVDFATAKGLRFSVGVLSVLFYTFFTRYIDMYRLSPLERYEQVVRRWPEVLQRVPLRELASFLGVTPVHLSRLRRGMLLR